MKCQDLLAALNEYIDGDIDPGMCEEFETHLKDCNPCQVVIDNIQKTITLYKAGKEYPLPLTFKNRLHATLKDKWQKKFTAQ